MSDTVRVTLVFPGVLNDASPRRALPGHRPGGPGGTPPADGKRRAASGPPAGTASRLVRGHPPPAGGAGCLTPAGSFRRADWTAWMSRETQGVAPGLLRYEPASALRPAPRGGCTPGPGGPTGASSEGLRPGLPSPPPDRFRCVLRGPDRDRGRWVLDGE